MSVNPDQIETTCRECGAPMAEHGTMNCGDACATQRCDSTCPLCLGAGKINPIQDNPMGEVDPCPCGKAAR